MSRTFSACIASGSGMRALPSSCSSCDPSLKRMRIGLRACHRPSTDLCISLDKQALTVQPAHARKRVHLKEPCLLELALAGADADLPPVIDLLMHAGRLLVLHVQIHIVLEGLYGQPLPVQQHLWKHTDVSFSPLGSLVHAGRLLVLNIQVHVVLEALYGHLQRTATCQSKDCTSDAQLLTVYLDKQSDTHTQRQQAQATQDAGAAPHCMGLYLLRSTLCCVGRLCFMQQCGMGGLPKP